MSIIGYIILVVLAVKIIGVEAIKTARQASNLRCLALAEKELIEARKFAEKVKNQK